MFKSSTSERLFRWKEFRRSLDSMNVDDAVQHTNVFWQSCPYTPYYLDYDKIENWPDPWQLIEENYYCDLAKTLGIVYTLSLTKHFAILKPELHVYIQQPNRYYYHIAYFSDGKYVLNLIPDEVVNKEHINQNLRLKYRFTATDLKLEQY